VTSPKSPTTSQTSQVVDERLYGRSSTSKIAPAGAVSHDRQRLQFAVYFYLYFERDADVAVTVSFARSPRPASTSRHAGRRGRVLMHLPDGTRRDSELVSARIADVPVRHAVTGAQTTRSRTTRHIPDCTPYCGAEGVEVGVRVRRDVAQAAHASHGVSDAAPGGSAACSASASVPSVGRQTTTPVSGGGDPARARVRPRSTRPSTPPGPCTVRGARPGPCAPTPGASRAAGPPSPRASRAPRRGRREISGVD
jgi:hypothetical protein